MRAFRRPRRPASLQRRHPDRSQRHRDQEPWRRRPAGVSCRPSSRPWPRQTGRADASAGEICRHPETRASWHEPLQPYPRHRRLSACGVLTNRELRKMVDTTMPVDRRSHRIREAPIAFDDAETPPTTLAVPAARPRPLRRPVVSPTDLDLIIIATTTPDPVFPSTAWSVDRGPARQPRGGGLRRAGGVYGLYLRARDRR